MFGPKDPNKFLDREFEAGTVLVSTRLQYLPADSAFAPLPCGASAYSASAGPCKNVQRSEPHASAAWARRGLRVVAPDLKRKPDLAKELGFFRMNPFNPTERM